jgi:hypothetical protein
MFNFFLIIIFLTSLNIRPAFSQDDKINVSFGTAFTSNEVFGLNKNIKFQNKGSVNFNLEYSKNNFSSNLSFNFDDQNNLAYDNSFINFQMGIANFNIGKVDRIWSFSDKSSLILSKNSRPLDAISIKLEDEFNKQLLSSNATWSVEVFNGITKNSYNKKNSMLSGARAIISPFEKLSFELLQTIQWGGESRKLNKSTIGALLLGDTNTGKNAEINKMAGFGISYEIPINKNTYRVYGQAIGEDEAGGLPSCYSWITGLELHDQNIKYPTKIAFEIIETRVDTTKNGFCGPNTAYNNNTYDYTNYNTVMGVPIDTEGTSFEVFGQSNINKNLAINFSLMLLKINDNNYSYHRLSSKSSKGSIISLGMIWKNNIFKLDGNISYQNITLDKAKITRGTVFSLKSSIDF